VVHASVEDAAVKQKFYQRRPETLVGGNNKEDGYITFQDLMQDTCGECVGKTVQLVIDAFSKPL